MLAIYFATSSGRGRKNVEKSSRAPHTQLQQSSLVICTKSDSNGSEKKSGHRNENVNETEQWKWRQGERAIEKKEECSFCGEKQSKRFLFGK